MQVTKGLRCHCCNHSQNVSVEEFILKALCPKCFQWVTLGEALGLTFGQTVVLGLLLLGLFG